MTFQARRLVASTRKAWDTFDTPSWTTWTQPVLLTSTSTTKRP